MSSDPLVAPAPSPGLDRGEFKVFRPPPSSANTPLQDLPDSYFTPSLADIKSVQTTLASRTQALTNAPLQTRAMREQADKPKRDRFPNTRIRVRFMDGTLLEKSFPSADRIKPVYAFVRACLSEDAKPIKFVLYQAPPVREYKVSDPAVRDLSLYDLQLAPSSILRIRFLEDALNHVNVPAPLAPDVLALAVDLPKPPDFDKQPAPSASSSGAGAPRQAQTGGQAPGTEGEKKIPKWLKLSKK